MIISNRLTRLIRNREPARKIRLGLSWAHSHGAAPLPPSRPSGAAARTAVRVLRKRWPKGAKTAKSSFLDASRVPAESLIRFVEQVVGQWAHLRIQVRESTA